MAKNKLLRTFICQHWNEAMLLDEKGHNDWFFKKQKIKAVEPFINTLAVEV